MRLLLFLVFTPAACATQARVIDVSAHGVAPGKDSTHALNRLVKAIGDESGVVLVFPKGRYDFYPENAIERHRAVSNHDNSLKRIAFPLFGCRDITVDGGGSTFMFHGRISPFVLDGVREATLRNFSVDWARSFHDELPVVESNPEDNSFVVEVDPQRYPHKIRHGRLYSQKYDWEDRMGSNIVFDPKTRAPIHNTTRYAVNFARPHEATALPSNRVKIEASVRQAPPVGSVLISYGVHPTSRLCPAIHLANSRDITIENVTIYEAGGMGVIAERTEDITLQKVTVTSAAGRLVSTRADATHFIGCRGEIRVENCLFEHMLDDAINVHGAYVMVEERLGEKQFLCAISHFQQTGLVFAGPGDRVALLSRETVLPFFQTEVQSVEILNEKRFVLTLTKVPDEPITGPLSLENLSWHPDLVMRNNTVRENRARSILVTTKGKVLIEDNYLSSQMNGILIEGDNKFWYESGAVEDVTIRGNTFVNSGFGAGEFYPLLASPMLTPEQRLGEGRYHRDIRFLNNRLRSFDGRLVKALSVEGLTISGNTLEFSADYPTNADLPAIDLTYCDRVTITGNKAIGFDRELAIRSSKDTGAVTASNNRGFAAPSE